MTNRANLIVRSTIFGNNTPVRDLYRFAERFSCVVADDGSDHCRFEVSASQTQTRELARWFETWLGYELRVETGDETVFRGLLRSIIFEAGGDAEIRSLRDMCNRMVVEFDGGETLPIRRIDDAESVGRWGEKICRVNKSELTHVVDATDWAKGHLYMRQMATAKPLAESTETRITFDFVGYLWLLDWLEITIPAGTTIKTAIESVVSVCGQGVLGYTTNSIFDDGRVLNGAVNGSGLSVLRALLEIGSAGDTLWRFWLDNDLIAHYEPLDLTPFYIKRVARTERASGTFVGLSSSQKVGVWEARAGVIRRNVSYPITGAQIGNPLLDRRDRYIEAVRFDIDGNSTFETLVDYPENRVLGIN